MAVIIDKNIDVEIIDKLKSLNIKYYKSTNLDFMYEPVNTHPDMQIHFINDTTAVVAPSAYNHYKNVLPSEVSLIKGYSDPDGAYPGDCAYNIAKLGKRIIGNLSYVDKTIKSIYSDLNYKFIDVRQGYTKCNLCIVDSNSVITEDDGLYKTLSDFGIEVLKIPVGKIKLKFFKHGFIGGSSGFIMKDTLGFCGKITEHEYFSHIEKFINKHNIDIIQLSQTELSDYGSILYFQE